MEKDEKLKKLKRIKKIEKELDKLQFADNRLIIKKQNFELMLEADKETDKKVKNKKMAKFMDKYLDYRLRVGAKRMQGMKKLQELKGAPRTVKVTGDELDAFFK